MEETISLKEIYETLKKRVLLIIALAVVALVASAIYSYGFLTPIYQSSTQLLVNQSREDGQFYTQSDLRTNMDLINTYNVIITSPRILEPVIEELGLERSYGALRNQITVGSERDSQVLFIRVEDPDPATAVAIANTTAAVFQEDIYEIMSVDNVSVLSSAELSPNPSPIRPNPNLNMAIALVVGLMAGVGIAFLLEFLDNTIKTEEQLETVLGIPALGSISSINEKDVGTKSLPTTRKTRTGRDSHGA
ncbi:YveK family protein [Evansella tamaricis]|uniref:Capsular biosynthesis protein n=1 Tax=Evansella tamaricis TaxID=2069301 RepID=A0ABS6JJX4_9BACI|nr:Wzz/FepE/Etk N-terminal domain-containing protein [Evansella tamaricis]MBU9713499.1 capsular biosynthesis protein [Evansella tamaricis]